MCVCSSVVTGICIFVLGTEDKTEYTHEHVICKLPAQSGFCKARFQRYYFNSDTNECEMFFYGGCGGNDNNFETVEECIHACGQDNSL